MTIKNIETTFAVTLKKELNVVVEVTNRGSSEWTISGSQADAELAAEWLTGKSLMVITDSVFDEELQESFYYMSSK